MQKVVPNDPDGLHLLGLALYSQGKLARKSSEDDSVTTDTSQGKGRLIMYKRLKKRDSEE